MINECPHCHRRVIPLAGGECPACHKDTTRCEGVDPNRTTALIGEKATLPDICCSCGSFTPRRIAIKRSANVSASKNEAERDDQVSGWASQMVLGVLFGSFGRLFAVFADRSTSSEMPVEVSIPQCELCSESQAIEPLHVNYDLCRMKFLVHKDFAKEFERVNRR